MRTMRISLKIPQSTRLNDGDDLLISPHSQPFSPVMNPNSLPEQTFPSMGDGKLYSLIASILDADESNRKTGSRLLVCLYRLPTTTTKNESHFTIY